MINLLLLLLLLLWGQREGKEIYSKKIKRKRSRGRSKGKEQAKGRKGRTIRENQTTPNHPPEVEGLGSDQATFEC